MYTSGSSIIRAFFMLASALLISSLTMASNNVIGQSAEPPKILVLGDSLSAAYGIQVDEGWVHLLEGRLNNDDDLNYQVINASISGETTGGGLRTLPALLKNHQPYLVIIELGANDGLRGFPIQVFERNLEQLVQLSKDQNAKVLLVGNHIPPNYGKDYSSAFFSIYEKVASKHETALVPFMLDRVAVHSELMQKDGLHPKANAQATILDTIWESLGPLLN